MAKACPANERSSIHPKNLGGFFRIEKMMWHKGHSVAVAPFSVSLRDDRNRNGDTPAGTEAQKQ